MRIQLSALAASAALALPAACVAQDAGSTVPEIGQPAPDFQVTGATRFGVLEAPVRLSDFRGETVVLAFFYRARTPG